ncbi:UNVERIFIED_CONTAM: hypothetical protein HDU68_008154 [Siphonaria sp. JEL0065]|nr:hypothetical protein HDU68_008154 [Siphonaria sp. JEL0065]
MRVWRIPNARHGTTRYSEPKPTKLPGVILWHGLGLSASSWVCNPSSRVHSNLAFLLADSGFDVWLVDGRGVISDKKGKQTSWNFSIDEIGYLDVPSVVDYVLGATGRESVSFIGFSQGTAAAFAALSISEELNRKHITTNIHLFAGTDDTLCDINIGKHHLPPHARITLIKEYNHLDLIWAVDAKEKVWDYLIPILRNPDQNLSVPLKKTVSFAKGTNYGPLPRRDGSSESFSKWMSRFVVGGSGLSQQVTQVEQLILENNEDDDYGGYETASSDEGEDERREGGMGQDGAVISEFSGALDSGAATFFVGQDGSSSSELTEAEYVADTPLGIAHSQYSDDEVQLPTDLDVQELLSQFGIPDEVWPAGSIEEEENGDHYGEDWTKQWINTQTNHQLQTTAIHEPFSRAFEESLTPSPQTSDGFFSCTSNQ